MNSFEQFYNKI